MPLLRWLEENIANGAHGLLEALIGGRPELLRVATRRWELESGADRVDSGKVDGDAAAADDGGDAHRAAAVPTLGPPPGGFAFAYDHGRGQPFVEPNRHATLMFYLNDVAQGGAEVISLHYITFITLRYIFITLHYITLHYMTLHYITLHYTALHCITLYCITLHYIALHCIILYYVTLRYVTLRYVILHYIILHV